MNNQSGKKFEKLIKDSCDACGFDHTRFRDAGWQGETGTRRFTVRNICDCIIFTGEQLHYIEAKSRIQSLRFDDITQTADLQKKRNQLDELAVNNVGVGLLVEFQKAGMIFWISVNALPLLRDFGKASFNAVDCLALSNSMSDYCTPITKFVPAGKRAEKLNLFALHGQ